MIQWHPLFAQLLRSLVEDHYAVETNVPVGDLPREADILCSDAHPCPLGRGPTSRADQRPLPMAITRASAPRTRMYSASIWVFPPLSSNSVNWASTIRTDWPRSPRRNSRAPWSSA